MLELEKASQEEEINGSQSLDLTAIEQIADGVEQMVFSWGLQKQERSQEYAELSKSLAKEDSQVLLPWSLNKTEELDLNSASESGMVAKNAHTVNATSGELASKGTQPKPVIGIKHMSPNRAQSKQRGNMWIGNFNNKLDKSASPVRGSENPHLLKAGDPEQVDTCHGVLTSSNRMRISTSQSKGGISHGFENKARENSVAYHAMTVEQESKASGDIEMETKKDNNVVSIPSIKSFEMTMSQTKGHELFNAKGSELGSCLGDGSSLLIPEEPTPTSNKKNQQLVVNQTRNQHPPSILTYNLIGNGSSLLSQSPVRVQSPSLRLETTRSSEAISDAQDAVFISLGDIPMSSPICENVLDDLTPLLPLLDATPSCEAETESVEVGLYSMSYFS